MSRLIDLTGQDFGFWHVLERAENSKDGQAYWKCKCTACGTIKNVSGSHLRAGRSTNCGCIRMQKMRNASIKNEVGKTYGFLKVNRKATDEERPRTDKTGIYWNCSCLKCGRENVIVFGDYLRNGDTKSCGCLNSFNESNICKILDNLGYKYVQQQTFDDLYGQTNRKCDRLMFDCAVYNNDKIIYIMEYDGIQHFEKGHFNKDFDITRKNDLIKNKYCFENNIPLIRIPYDKDYDVNDLKIETTRFLLTPENEKDYYESRGLD